MKIQTGYFYFIKDKFFEIINDKELMQNKENGSKRPCYYCFKSKTDDRILWFIPVSTKVEKYKKVYLNKINKQKELGKKQSVDTIVFGYVSNVYSTFLIQNMFPVSEKYIEKQYKKNNVAITLSKELENEVISKANKVLNLYKHGMKKIVFPNIEEILKVLKKNI